MGHHAPPTVGSLLQMREPVATPVSSISSGNSNKHRDGGVRVFSECGIGMLVQRRTSRHGSRRRDHGTPEAVAGSPVDTYVPCLDQGILYHFL